jgi:AraC-like DNA-binding protein
MAQGSRHLLEHAVSRGADRAELLARAAIDPTCFSDPDARVAAPSYYALIEAAAELTRDPFFAVRYLENITPDAIGAVGYLAVSSATLGQSLRRIIRYHRVLAEQERFSMRVEGELAIFELESWGPAREAHAHIAEMYAYDCTALAARLTGAEIDVRAIRFRHAARAPIDRYEAIFGHAPQFERGHNRFEIAASDLERPMLRADEGLVRVLEPNVERTLGALPEEEPKMADRVRAALAHTLCDGEPELKSIAAGMRMSTRTLQRRLEAEGASFVDLVDEVRRARALEWIRADRSLAEISFLLGYSEPRAFYRAFRRWTGRTPSDWRRENVPRAPS